MSAEAQGRLRRSCSPLPHSPLSQAVTVAREGRGLTGEKRDPDSLLFCTSLDQLFALLSDLTQLNLVITTNAVFYSSGTLVVNIVINRDVRKGICTGIQKIMVKKKRK